MVIFQRTFYSKDHGRLNKKKKNSLHDIHSGGEKSSFCFGSRVITLSLYVTYTGFLGNIVYVKLSSWITCGD